MDIPPVKEMLFKPIPDLDAEIRFIEDGGFPRRKDWPFRRFLVEIGLFVSAGERYGEKITFDYSVRPSDFEIKRDVAEYLCSLMCRLLRGYALSDREETQLNLLIDKIKPAKVFSDKYDK